MTDMTKFRGYKKTAIQLMRPYIPGEDMDGISIGIAVEIGPGGMVAIDPKDHNDQWYVPKDYFEEYYDTEPV